MSLCYCRDVNIQNVPLQDNLRLGKKLATGGFGTVFKADLIDDEDPNDVRDVIVKKVQ